MDEKELFETWFNSLPTDEEGFAVIHGSRLNYGMAWAGWEAKTDWLANLTYDELLRSRND